MPDKSLPIPDRDGGQPGKRFLSLNKTEIAMNSGAALTRVGSRLDRFRVILTSEESIAAFVWATWLTLTLVDLLVLATQGRNLPLTEDFWLVAPLTGNEPNLIEWLWAQNNEHRIPFPRLILLGLLKMSGGDWRVGMMVNILLLAIVAAIFLLLTRRLHGGRTYFADAIIPLTLLSLGHWENLFWSWQLTQVLPVALTLILLILILNLEGRLRPATAVIAGVVLVLLPLSGGNGLLWLPFCLPFFVFAAIRTFRNGVPALNERLSLVFLIMAATVAGVLGLLYLIGYEQPAWVPPNPGILPSLYAVLQFLALSLGPGARSSWTPAIVVVLLLLAPTIGLLLSAIRRFWDKPEGLRAVGLAAYVANGLLFALALGYSRASAIPVFGGWPTRYVLFTAPLLIASFFVWLLYAREGLYRTLATAVTLLLFFLLPFNMWHGYEWHFWISQQDQALIDDVSREVPVEVLAERYQQSLSPHEPPHKTALLLGWLREDGLPPFQKDDKVTQRITYYQPAAQRVDLVWGVNGWQALPEAMRPAGTYMADGVMHTPMTAESYGHQNSLTVPTGSMLDFGFLLRDVPAGQDGRPTDLWEANGSEDYHINATDGGLFQARSSLIEHDGELRSALEIPVVEQEIVYMPPSEGEVTFVWGIDGWRVPPLSIDLSDSNVQDGVVRTPMARSLDGRHITHIAAPAGSAIDCGFLTNPEKNPGNLIWDDACSLTATGEEARTFVAAETAGQTIVSLPDNEPTTTVSIRYGLPAAQKVNLVWGIDGFKPLSLADSPPGTILTDNGVLSTPMARDGEEFVIELRLPVGSTLDYGFLVTERRPPLSLIRPAWDGDYEAWPVGREPTNLHLTPDSGTLSALPVGMPPLWQGWIIAVGGLFLLFWGGLTWLQPHLPKMLPNPHSVDSVLFRGSRQQRDLLRELVQRDLKLRYRRSYLGILWSLINPLLQLVVFGLVFSFILPLDIEYYPLFLFIGLLPWIWFQSSLLSGTTSIVDNRDLIRRPGFRSGILPVVSVCSNLIHFLLSLPVVLAIVLIVGAELGNSIVLLPFIIVVQFLFTLAIVNFLAAVHVTFRDTQHLVSVFLLLWFYLTPIFYNADIIPVRYQSVFALNPMLHIINAYRDVLMYGQWPSLVPLIGIGTMSLLVILVGHRTLAAANNHLVEEL